MSLLGKLRQGEYERGEEKLTVVVIKEEKHHGCSRRLRLETVALEKGRAMPLGSYSAEKIFRNEVIKERLYKKKSANETY